MSIPQQAPSAIARNLYCTGLGTYITALLVLLVGVRRIIVVQATSAWAYLRILTKFHILSSYVICN